MYNAIQLTTALHT